MSEEKEPIIENITPSHKEETVSILEKSEKNNTETENIKLSMYQKLYTDKNIKLSMFITLVYLVINSEQFYQFLGNNLPMLIIDDTPGFLGKTILGLILSIVLIIFTSFFSI
jgi:hypothetical protein